MALSFLYLGFVRILRSLRQSRRDSADLAMEVVMLHHEVAVLRRQVAPSCSATNGPSAPCRPQPAAPPDEISLILRAARRPAPMAR
jgi:hypothetical protein